MLTFYKFTEEAETERQTNNVLDDWWHFLVALVQSMLEGSSADKHPCAVQFCKQSKMLEKMDNTRTTAHSRNFIPELWSPARVISHTKVGLHTLPSQRKVLFFSYFCCFLFALDIPFLGSNILLIWSFLFSVLPILSTCGNTKNSHNSFDPTFLDQSLFPHKSCL